MTDRARRDDAFTSRQDTHDLPAQPTPLIGRDREVKRARSELLRGHVRLLTLVGPPGIGKTRLAVKVAAGLLNVFQDGVRFVDLAPITRPALVLPTIARALRIREGRRPLPQRLGQALRDRELLLVLDNFEQVLPAAPQVAALLTACARVKVLATSRAVLHLRWEHEFPVPPLALPEGEVSLSWDTLVVYPALALFEDRARAVVPDFRLDDHNAHVVAEICRRLDGLPLAIELAASRTKVLSAEAILDRLHQRLALLDEGPVDLPVRHQTLRSAIAGSYDLLPPQEQAMFRRLAVFVGSCTLEGAEAVSTGAESGDVLKHLNALVDKSLLRREPAADGMVRFRMLETIREYAWEALAGSNNAALTRLRHAEFYRGLVERAEPELRGPEQALWLERLEAEHANLRAALEWSQSAEGDPESGLELAVAPRQFWFVRGYWTEGREWLERALSLSPEPSSASRANALNGMGVLSLHLGDYQAAAARYEESLKMFRALGNRRGEALVLDNLGTVARYQNEPERAVALSEESLALFRELSDRLGAATSLRTLGELARAQGAYPRARALYEESLQLYRELGDRQSAATSLHNLGHVARHQGDLTEAAALFEESLAVYRELGDKKGVAECLAGLATVATAHGRLEASARISGRAAAMLDAIGARLDHADRTEFERNMAIVGAGISAVILEQALAAGREMMIDDAVDYALSAARSPAAKTPRPGTSAAGASRLTPRELEVAALIARGLRNPEIAAALNITLRTVTTHVQHILNKLGLHSRTQIAAWAVERRHDTPASTDG